MTQFLPPNLLALFAAREAIPYLPPADKLPHEKKTRGYSGVGAFLSHFEVNKTLIFAHWISAGSFWLLSQNFLIF